MQVRQGHSIQFCFQLKTTQLQQMDICGALLCAGHCVCGHTSSYIILKEL